MVNAIDDRLIKQIKFHSFSLMDPRQQVISYLDANQIQFHLCEHPPVFTCEEAKQFCPEMEGIAAKNILLKDRKNKRFVLVIIPAEQRLDLDKIKACTQSNNMSFANAKELKDQLGLDPGSVSPFGLLNNSKVFLILDKLIWNAEHVTFHPNDNTATLSMSNQNFRFFLDTLSVQAHIV